MVLDPRVGDAPGGQRFPAGAAWGWPLIDTIRAYAGRVASFLGWCADQGVEWSSIRLSGLARFKHFVEATPRRDGRLRSGATVNAILTAVCEFLGLVMN